MDTHKESVKWLGAEDKQSVERSVRPQQYCVRKKQMVSANMPEQLNVERSRARVVGLFTYTETDTSVRASAAWDG